MALGIELMSVWLAEAGLTELFPRVGGRSELFDACRRKS
jgi:hypothetical protein